MALKSGGLVIGGFVIERKLRSTSSAEQNSDEITWIQNEAKTGDMAVLEIRFGNLFLGKWSKIGPATGVMPALRVSEDLAAHQILELRYEM